MTTTKIISKRPLMDVTPRPRLLALLENVDIEPWRCVAELMDNSLDDFRSNGVDKGEIKLEVTDGWLTVSDNGTGMNYDQLQKAITAGFSSKDMSGELGLFGIGFNVATARLGRKATVITKQTTDTNWLQVDLDLNNLIQKNSFKVQPNEVSYDSSSKKGTTVSIQLRPEHAANFSRKAYLAALRRDLGRTYTYLLRNSVPGLTGECAGNSRDIQILIDGSPVLPWMPCIWDENRSVEFRGAPVLAVQKFEQLLSDSIVCNGCGYWHPTSVIAVCDRCGSDSLNLASRRVWGWVGVQRYLDSLEFGIDFIRNGRTISAYDQDVFTFEDPTTGLGSKEYPQYWPADQGRIVGEVHLDHVRVDFTKKSFVRDDPYWSGALGILRGDSPLRPGRRVRGSAVNSSPLATLFSAYVQNEPGSKYLIPGNGKTAINQATKNWADNFRSLDPEFQSDKKWYNAVIAHDNSVSGASSGAPTSTSVPGPTRPLGPVGPPSGTPTTTKPTPPPAESPMQRMDRLKAGGVRREDLTKSVTPLSANRTYKLEVWETVAPIPDQSGNDLAVYAEPIRGNEIHIFAARHHPVFSKFGRDTTDLILMEAAHQIKTLSGSSVPASFIYSELLAGFPDEEKSEQVLRSRIAEFETRLRDRMAPVIFERANEFWKSLSKDNRAKAEENSVAAATLVIWTEAVAEGRFAYFLNLDGMHELIVAHPERFFDGKVFKQALTTALAAQARDRSLGYVSNAVHEISRIASISANLNEYELGLVDHSINYLNDSLVGTA